MFIINYGNTNSEGEKTPYKKKIQNNLLYDVRAQKPKEATNEIRIGCKSVRSITEIAIHLLAGTARGYVCDLFLLS